MPEPVLQVEHLTKSFGPVVALRDLSLTLRKGEVLDRENCRIVRPGFGLEPKFYDIVLGKPVNADIPAGTPLGWHHLGQPAPDSGR